MTRAVEPGRAVQARTGAVAEHDLCASGRGELPQAVIAQRTCGRLDRVGGGSVDPAAGRGEPRPRCGWLSPRAAAGAVHGSDRSGAISDRDRGGRADVRVRRGREQAHSGSGTPKRAASRATRSDPTKSSASGLLPINQLRRHHIVPDRSYGKHGRRKPDGIVVDRRGNSPVVKFVVEFKGQHKLNSENRVRAFGEKVADEYCRPLGCEFGGLSDRENNSWPLVTLDDWRFILREDDYPLDYPIDLSARSVAGNCSGRTLQNLETNLNKP